MNKFIHTDGQNLFYRQAKMSNPAIGIDGMIGMSLHMILNSMKKEFTTWGGTHVVFYLEGKSWRKSIYPEYKANRKVAFAQLTPKEQEDHSLLQEAFDDFVEYLNNKTNITVLRNPTAEADDMISIFIESHPNDEHMLISSDSDFFQLLRHPNVTIFDPVKDILIKRDGVYDEKGKKLEFSIVDCKIKAGKHNDNFTPDEDWYEYVLFMKCIRGDKTDNIFSAYPGVREKGTKKQIGIREAYEDRNAKGYKWNNFMLQRWIDHNQQERRVKEQYELNRKLIDLSQIPDNIKEKSLQIIAEELERKHVAASNIGFSFLKFTGKWDLKKIGDNAHSFMPMLTAKYSQNK